MWDDQTIMTLLEGTWDVERCRMLFTSFFHTEGPGRKCGFTVWQASVFIS